MKILRADRNWKTRDYLFHSAVFLAAVLLIGYMFYGTPLAGLIGIVFLPAYWNYVYGKQEEKRRKRLSLEFREMLSVLASELQAGYSPENAFRQTLPQIRRVYGADAPITEGLEKICKKLDLNIPVEPLLEEFAEESRDDDILHFVSIFSSAKRTGGDMVRIIRHTAEVMSEKIEIEREIASVMASKRYEFRLMTAIPMGIILYMRLTFPGFTSILYGNVFGIVFMTIALGLMVFAARIGQKMVSVEV